MYIPKWTSRTFDFDFPADRFAFILERLYGTAPRIQYMIKNLSPEKLTHQPNGAWSIQEHIGHLIDLDELHDGRIDDYLEKKPVLRAADMSNKKTYEAHYNQQNLQQLLTDFAQKRQNFIERIKTLDPTLAAQHPRLQKNMRVVDMAFFVAEHHDHHLAIVREIIES